MPITWRSDAVSRIVASPTPQPMSSTTPGPSPHATSRYPASWSARRESGVDPSIGRSPVSFMVREISGGALLESAAVAAPDVNGDVVDQLGDLAAGAGIRRIPVLAWRELDDPEAGGSELHAHEVLRLWSAAGIEINLRTSYAAGKPQVIWRDGYRVIRKAGRYLVFPRSILSEVAGWHGERDALVEIWNGMPFFTPLWCRGRRVTWLHHVHDTMWEMTLPPRLARFGRMIEFDLAPPMYRFTHTPVVTLSQSSKQELVERLHLRDRDVHVIPVGIGAQYTPGAASTSLRSPTPLVVAVGRLVPVKQFPMLVDALVAARRDVPNLEAVIIGEGYERGAIERRIQEAQAEGWIRLT